MPTPSAELIAKLKAMWPNQADLARAAGIGQHAVSRFFAGQNVGVKFVDAMLTASGMKTPEPVNMEGHATLSGFHSIPFFEQQISAGAGADLVDAKVKSHLAFQTSWLMSKGNPQKMGVYRVVGDSMSPTIPDGAIVLVDRAQNVISNNRIYLISFHGSLMVKRLKKENGTVVVSGEHNSGEIVGEQDNFHVIGRVVWYGAEL